MNQKMTEDFGKLQKKFDDNNANLQKQLDDHNANLQKQLDGKLQKQVDDLREQMAEDNADLQKQLDDHNTKLQAQVDDLGKKMSKMCEMQTEMMTKVTQIMTEMKQLKEMSPGQHLGRKNIIIAGGWDEKANINSVEIFSWSQKTWTLIKPMSTALTYASAVTYKGEVLISGGYDGKEYTDTIETSSCDQSAEWKISRVKLPEVRGCHVTVMYKDSLILSGGKAGLVGQGSDKIYEVSMVPPYSTKVLTTMPEPRSNHTMELFEDKLFIFGGWHRGVHDTVMLYDLVTKEWKMMKPLPFPVDVMASVLWQNNAILLGGAIRGGYCVTDSVVTYNLTTGESKYLPSMKHKRRGCAAVVTGDVLVVMGGHDGSNYLKSVEVFHFLKQVWEELPEMNEARLCPSAVVKPN